MSLLLVAARRIAGSQQKLALTTEIVPVLLFETREYGEHNRFTLHAFTAWLYHSGSVRLTPGAMTDWKMRHRRSHTHFVVIKIAGFRY